ncbi:maleylacetoacetate isomerase [Sphingomonas sp. 8AM]|uniref:maleylacetoacetate isomerase n=1 Tax=Sphingomonas sp. 8AM TaxID=2653170 RepID=UPI0012F2CF3D|nr:maleylacetoacetate isomerase [Sphingomonas sp. 8AM]VXC78015.1 putative maleylacetoacetate isomerase [Sphingomonas sp. 8AM]
MTATADRPVLHGYFRSTAACRVRIALNLKQVAWRDAFHHLRHGEQRAPDYLRLNPQGLVPALEWDGAVLTQSLAICEYLDERIPAPPLLPADPVARAQVRAFAQVIACDTHPVQNLRVLRRLRSAGLDEPAVNAWARDTISDGLVACEALIADGQGPYCFGAQVTLADLCLVPQLFNARRFGVELVWPRLLAVEAACLALPAFAAAAPERQPDAE